ncbi:MAG: ATP-binding protein [Porticoccaceae bacterium]
MGRLFWKIFLWFWLALALLNLTVGWGVKLYLERTNALDDRALQTQVMAIAMAFEQGNIRKTRHLLREATKENLRPVYVIDHQGQDVLGRSVPRFLLRNLDNPGDDRRVYQAKVTLPNGTSYQVLAPRRPVLQDHFTAPPLWLALSITLVISTLVCYWLANYLSSPIRLLSNATRQLAKGRLDVRTGKLKRRDELADLARDFDQMADKIQQLLGAQKQLMQDISHELRSPLARLQVALALAMRDGDNRQVYYDRLATDLDRLETLIGQVLTLSRLDTVNYEKEELDFSELVATILDNCRIEATHKGCKLAATLSSGINIHGSPELLHRAVENVVRNAIKFTPHGEQIEVSLSRADGVVRIAVKDRGPGIPEGSAASLFEPFVRLDEARQHKTGGYGLGLAIAKKAVELHNGAIGAHNREGGGLEVSIQLPSDAS